MKLSKLNLGVYLGLAFILSACAQSFQEKKVTRIGGAKSGSDVQVTRNSDQSLTLSFNGIKLQVSNTKVEEGRAHDVCKARLAAIGDGVIGSMIQSGFHRISGQASLQIDSQGGPSAINMDTCVGYRTVVGNDGANKEEIFDGVSQTQGKEFYSSFFTRCVDTKCSEAYGLLKLAINNYQTANDEYRECGFQFMNFDNTVDAVCLEKGQSFASSGGVLGVQCHFNEGDSVCNQIGK